MRNIDATAVATAPESAGTPGPTIPEMKERLRLARIADTQALALVTPISEEIKAKVKAYEDKLNAEHAEKFKLAEDARAELAAADTELRIELIHWYNTIGKSEKKKAFDPELSVAVTDVYSYAEDEAKDWARENAKFLLSEVIDKKSFEKLPNFASLEFVKEEEPKVVAKIATTFK